MRVIKFIKEKMMGSRTHTEDEGGDKIMDDDYLAAINREYDHETYIHGVKLDSGKPRAHLVLGGFANALLAVSEVGTFGAEKYSDDGWKSVSNGVERYSDALMRHQLADARGEVIDPESGLAHAAMTAWNALAVLELKIKARKQASQGLPKGYKPQPGLVMPVL